jgi:gamma-glutamyl hercynylcysteine S-oxide synthase
MTTVGFTDELSHSNPIAIGRAARHYGRSALRDELIALRALLREFVERLTDPQLAPPSLDNINPPLWEAAHVAWFAEWWCVRDAYNTIDGETRADTSSVWDGCDAFLNSNTIAHDARWHVPPITRAATLDYLDRSLAATLAQLERADETDEALYPFRLAMFHEAMHLEAIAWCAQTLAWPNPAWVRSVRSNALSEKPIFAATNDAAAGRSRAVSEGFAFDNELGLIGHELAPASSGNLSDRPVSHGEFALFVESGAYRRAVGRAHPIYWRIDQHGQWQQRHFNEWMALAIDEPVIHVSAIEAEAYAQWIGARLPSEPEMHAWFGAPPPATVDTVGAVGSVGSVGTQHAVRWHGKVWEWTSTTFAPYEGFQPHRYREYSEPWFDGKHRVLRGGSYATLPVMHHPNYRNFFQPHRSDVFAGFRVVTRR